MREDGTGNIKLTVIHIKTMVKIRGMNHILLRQDVKEGIGHWVLLMYHGKYRSLYFTGVWKKINKNSHIFI